jgi:DNA-binding SARP family transcriptional activator
LPEHLELIAHGATAILATWLGLIVLTRARQQPGARIFAALTGCLVIWSLAIIVEQLSTQPGTVNRSFRAIEDVTAYLLPVGTLHVALALAVEGRRSAIQQGTLLVIYAVSLLVALGAVLFPEQRLAVTPPHLELPGIPGEALGWAWIAARVFILAAALYWICRSLASVGADDARRKQLLAALATVTVGAFGGILRFLPGPADSIPWVGVSIMGLAIVLAAYGVFAQGVFLSPAVAGQAFRYSLVIGLGVTVYVAALIALDRWTRDLLAIDVPIVTAMALVITLALFDPIADRLRRTVRGRTPRQTAYDRLLRALGEDVLTAQRPEGAVVPVLARLSRTFRLLGAAVETKDRVVVAHHGHPVAESPLALRLPLRSVDTDLGWVVFGPKRSLLPFTPQEVELLTLAAGFLAASLHLAERHDSQAETLAVLSADRDALQTRGEALSDALVQAESRDAGLQVFALGPLRVERGGIPLRQWGGAKAGTRHAEAVFAFIFDRGERGASKDELIELIWPDVDLKRADLAFHRTLGGLRTTLEPGRAGGDRGDAITFRNDRYRLDASLVEWSDVRAFEDEMTAASATPNEDTALLHLERARALYRGDYLDDCPFFGDSAAAEERRELLRGRYVDLLLALGERYEHRGDRPAAASAFRQARTVSGVDLPPADEALARLGLPA